jgi:hypothetical protein
VCSGNTSPLIVMSALQHHCNFSVVNNVRSVTL